MSTTYYVRRQGDEAADEYPTDGYASEIARTRSTVESGVFLVIRKTGRLTKVIHRWHNGSPVTGTGPIVEVGT